MRNWSSLTAHGVVRVYRVVLEVVWECADEELVEDTTLIHVEIVCDFVETPRCEHSRVVVGCIEAVTTGQADGIRQNDTRNSVCRLYHGISKDLLDYSG